MDKSCRVYGNFRTGNHGMIAGRRAYIAVLLSVRNYAVCLQAVYDSGGCQGKDVKTINIQSSIVAEVTGLLSPDVD